MSGSLTGINYMDDNGHELIETTVTAEDKWVAHVNEIGDTTLYPSTRSWYTGANVPGKPRFYAIHRWGSCLLGDLREGGCERV